MNDYIVNHHIQNHMTEISEYSNIPSGINAKRRCKLHLQKNHPLEIITKHIYKYFNSTAPTFDIFEDLSEVVTTVQNFDSLLIPPCHPSRSKSDTYYVNENHVLRSHTSAHQTSLMAQGYTKFLVTGDVYRKDEIDRNHYPVFHQMEGVFILTDEEQSDPKNANWNPETELKRVLSGLSEYLFPGQEYRFNTDYFPFTEPSFELEVKFNDDWLEVLGCGVIQPSISNNRPGWAFGVGIERLAMILFGITDIRTFWSTDSKFLDQFADGVIKKFVPYSKLDPETRDISFWINDATVKTVDTPWPEENDFYDLCRQYGGDEIERIERFDCFFHPKTARVSYAFRITYSPVDTKLNDPAKFHVMAQELHDKIVSAVTANLQVTVR